MCGVSFRSVGAGSKPARGSGCWTRQGARKLHGLPLPSVGGGVPTAPQRQGADFCPSLRASAHTGAAIRISCRIPVLSPKQRDGLPRAASGPRNDIVGTPAYCNRLWAGPGTPGGGRLIAAPTHKRGGRVRPNLCRQFRLHRRGASQTRPWIRLPDLPGREDGGTTISQIFHVSKKKGRCFPCRRPP